MKYFMSVAFAVLMIVSTAVSVLADATPPTNGGNGAGQSGQCTGNPSDRPAVCPGT